MIWLRERLYYLQASRQVHRELNKKKATAGQTDALTKSERVCKIIDSIIDNVTLEIRELKTNKNKSRRKKNVGDCTGTGLLIQGVLELEEVSRQSEEYERLMGM